MRRLWFVVLALAMASAALAHDVAKGPNGGPMRAAGDKHLELVVDAASIVVFVSDKAHEPVPAKGLTGRAVVQDGGKVVTVTLAAADGNRLVGSAPQPIGKGARIVVSATLAGGQVLQARFDGTQ